MPSLPPVGISAIGVDDSIEALFTEHGTMSRGVYLATLVTTCVAITVAAVTNIDLTIRAPATFAANIDRQTLHAASDGMVERIAISIGSRVHAGDTLAILSPETARRALDASTSALAMQRRRKADLQILLGRDVDGASPYDVLQLEQSRAAARAADVEWRQGTVQVTRADKTRERQARLMEKGFAIPAELEAADFELARAREDRALALEHRRSAWAEELATTRQHITDLQRDVAARSSERAARYITAPVSGTIEEIMPLTAGSQVRTGDAIATISPDGALVANALVSPRDVGYLHAGMPARVLVEGYDVLEWGAADAVVTFVAHDYTLADGHPVFRVRLTPTRPTLRRANGATAYLGKGLHGQVRFLLGKRRIAHLLTRRAREWFDPATGQ
ncbi:MAG: secretion protein HlyD [Gemmatimonadetes bacterium]|nr:secretion protein HlyD [Gemmatimonadota bacterium]